MQQVHISSLNEYENKLKGKVFASPTLVMIGKVVALHEKFGWVENATEQEEYFKPVEDVQYEQLINESINNLQ